MAIKNITKDLEKLIDNNAELQDHLRKKMGLRDFHQIEITADESAAAFQRGTQRMLLKAGYSKNDVQFINKKYNTVSVWKTLIARMFTELGAGPRVKKFGFSLIVIQRLNTYYKSLTKRGVYMLPRGSAGSNSRRIVIRLFNMKKAQKTSAVDDVTLDGFTKAFRDYAYDKWRTSLPNSLKGMSGTTGGTLENTGRSAYGGAASQQFGIKSPFVHDAGYEVGTRVLQEIKNDVQGVYQEGVEFHLLGVTGIYEEVVNKLMGAVVLDYEDKVVPTEDGGVKYARIVRGKIGGINFAGSSPGDIKNIKTELLAELADYLDKHATKFGFDEESGLDYETSKPVRRVLAENAKNKIVSGVKKQLLKKSSKNRKVKAKVNSKAAKKSSRKITVKKSRKVKSRTIRAALMVKGKGVKRAEQQKQEKAQGLNKLRTIIQKRLPAEVRRNMGRPELINRTGTFSNSAQLVNLRRTKMGISGEYTYKLNPYATFESLGNKKWPTGYNPKPLITKSIRELAMQYTEEKIVSLRRI